MGFNLGFKGLSLGRMPENQTEHLTTKPTTVLKMWIVK